MYFRVSAVDFPVIQSVMPFQKEPAPVTLRVRAAGENLAGKGALRIRARHAWVSPSFSHYENVYLDLPKGTYEYQDFELTITPTEPLRAIYLQPEMAAGVTAVMATDLYPYWKSDQLVGVINGMKGAAEYEHLVGVTGWGILGMSSQSIAHLLIILFIIMGNIGYLAGRLHRRTDRSGSA